jgi:hypothetical protein
MVADGTRPSTLDSALSLVRGVSWEEVGLFRDAGDDSCESDNSWGATEVLHRSANTPRVAASSLVCPLGDPPGNDGLLSGLRGR